MSAKYYKYRTDFNNVIVESGTSSMVLNFNEQEILIDASNVSGESLYNYRYDGTSIVVNDVKSINHYVSYLNYAFKINESVLSSGGSITDVTISGTTTFAGIIDETQTIAYGTPSANSIPTLNLIFNNVQVLGNEIVPFSTVNGWSINWDLTNNQLNTFSFTTTDGIPASFKDLLPYTLRFMDVMNPYIVITGSNISNFDDSYWVNFINGTDFVLVSKTRNLTIYLSTLTLTYIPKTFATTLMGIDSLNRVFDTGIKSTMYGTEFNYATSTGTTTSSSTVPQIKVTLMTNDLPLGLYEITANWTWSHSATNNSAHFDITLNGGRIGQEHHIEVSDKTNILTETKISYNIMNGINNIQLRFWNEGSSTSIYDASVKLIRVK